MRFLSLSLILSNLVVFQVRADFLDPKEAVRSFGLPAHIVSATVPISVYGFNSDQHTNCAAARVSDDGYFLTAAHCVEKCLEDNEKVPAVQQTEDLYYQFSPTASRLCEIEIAGQGFLAQIVVSNPCTAHTSSMKYLESFFPKKISVDNRYDTCKDYGDIAIFRIQPGKVNALGKTACLPLDLSTASTVEDVMTLGFPVKTTRHQNDLNAKDSDGRQLFASLGKIVKQHYCTPTNGQGQIPLQPGTDVLTNILYQLTVDAVQGNSGGPLINKSGKVIGVITGGDESENDKMECRGGSLAASNVRLAANAKAWSPNFSLGSIKCAQAKSSKK